MDLRESIRQIGKSLIESGFAQKLKSVLSSFSASSWKDIEEVDLSLAHDSLLTEYCRCLEEKRPLKKFERIRYGLLWEAVCVEKKSKQGKVTQEPVRPLLDVEIEMQMFLRYERGQSSPGGLGRYEHCKRGIEMIWGPKSRKPCIFNPYAERMFRAFCEHKFLAVAGHASGGKSFNPAVWSLWNFLCDPWNTKVLITSTSLKDSKGRIWGDIEEMWGAATDAFGGDMPGKLVPSEGIIRCIIQGKATDKAGLTLIAGDKSKAGESIGKLVGFKRSRLFFICDEMPDLSETLTNAAESNLVNNPWFQMIGIGNPDSFYDPFGKFCEPKEGWASVNETLKEWQGVKAYVLRFDAANSPNIAAYERGDTSNPFMGLLKWQDYEDAKSRLKENSARFYRMYRAFWCPTGSVEAIYSEQEIITYQADKPAGHGWNWMGDVVTVCGLDPAYKTDGDRAIAYFAKLGLNSNRVLTFCFTEFVQFEQNVNDSESRDMQIIKQLAVAMERRGVLIKNLGVDVTGAASFGTLVRQNIGDGFLAVEFGGRPSDMPAGSLDKRPAKDVYDRMVAELWHVGKELISTGQLKGLHPDAIKEMVARTYGTSGGKIWVEPKKDMKKRTGFSPDIFDAACIALHVARMRHGLISGAKAKIQEGGQIPTENAFAVWAKRMQETETFFGQTFTYGDS